MSAVRSARGATITVLVGPAPDQARDAAAWSAHWATDPGGVIDQADAMRMATAPTMPSAAHEALARLQHAMGAGRCILITREVSGLLQKAAAADVLELDGSLWRLRCADDADHPRVGVFGAQPRGKRCAVCGGALRPDVVLPGEPPDMMAEAREAVRRSRLVLAVEVSASDQPMQALLGEARRAGVRTWAVHPAPDPQAAFDQVLEQAAEAGLPRLVGRWLAEV